MYVYNGGARVEVTERELEGVQGSPSLPSEEFWEKLLLIFCSIMKYFAFLLLREEQTYQLFPNMAGFYNILNIS